MSSAALPNADEAMVGSVYLLYLLKSRLWGRQRSLKAKMATECLSSQLESSASFGLRPLQFHWIRLGVLRVKGGWKGREEVHNLQRKSW